MFFSNINEEIDNKIMLLLIMAIWQIWCCQKLSQNGIQDSADTQLWSLLS